MKLKETAIVIQENTIEVGGYTNTMVMSAFWNANLEAYEEKTDAIVQMSRSGNTPSGALDNLLNAMKEAGMRT